MITLLLTVLLSTSVLCNWLQFSHDAYGSMDNLEVNSTQACPHGIQWALGTMSNTNNLLIIRHTIYVNVGDEFICIDGYEYLLVSMCNPQRCNSVGIFFSAINPLFNPNLHRKDCVL
jgi:hypothetical protein